MKLTRLAIQTAANVVGTNGMLTKTWTDAVTLAGTLLPVDNTIVQQGSGQEIRTDYSFFVKKNHAALVRGNRALVNGEYLFIVKVLNYGKVVEVGLGRMAVESRG